MQAGQRKMGRPTLEAANALKERLLGAALRMLCLRGIGGLAMDALAEEAGVTKRTIYRHFDSKIALVEAVVDREVLRLESAILPIDAERPYALLALETWGRQFLSFTLDESIRRFCIFLNFEQRADPDLAARVRIWMARGLDRPVGLVSEAQAQGSIAPGDPLALALLLMDLLNGPSNRMTFNYPPSSVMGGVSQDAFFSARWAIFLSSVRAIATSSE